MVTNKGQPGQGTTYEVVVAALFGLKLYTNPNVTDFEIEFNKQIDRDKDEEEFKFDDLVVRIQTKDGNPSLHVAMQIKHAEENSKNTYIQTDNFIKGSPTHQDSREFKGDLVLNMYARTSFCSKVRSCAESNCGSVDCQEIHCSVEDSEDCKLLHRSRDRKKMKPSIFHFILYTNRKFEYEHKNKLKEFIMSKKNSDPGKSYFYTIPKSKFDDESNSEDNIYEFQATMGTTTETSNVNIEDYNLFFSKFSLYTSQKNAKDVEETIKKLFKKEFKLDRHNDYIAFFRRVHSNFYKDRKINKNIIRIQLINMLLKPQTLSIYDKDLNLFEEALKKFEVTTINESYKNFEELYCHSKNEYVDKLDDKTLYNIGVNLKIIPSNENEELPRDDTTKIKKTISWFHSNRLLIIDYDSKSSEEKETVTPTINLCRDIHKNSFVIVGQEVDTNFPDININSFQNLRNLVQQSPELCKKLEPKLKVHLRRDKSLLLRSLVKNTSYLYNFVTPADVIQMLKGNFYIEETRKESQNEFYVPRKLSYVLIRKTSIIPSEDNIFIVSFRGFSFKFKKMFLQSLPSQSKGGCPIIPSDRRLTEEQFHRICDEIGNEFPDINIHYLQVIDENYLQWITTKGHINQIRKHAVVKMFISEDEIFKCKKKINIICGLSGFGTSNIFSSNNKINLICGLSGLGKTKLLRRLKDICPLNYLTIFVRLPEYKNNFNEQRDATRCIYSFLDVIDKNGFKQELLKMLTDQKKIIFFLDGFDELHYNEAEHAKECIKQISHLGFQIWITARDICREDLEKTFNTISITITPYSTQSEQEKYVEKELKFRKKNSAISATKKLIANLTTKNKEILELPLHLSMIVEIYEKNNSEISNVEDVAVLTLYRYFIEEKHLQFCINQTMNLKILEATKRHYTEQYGKAALKTCLNQNLLDRLHVFYNTDYDAFLQEDKDPWGLFSTSVGPTFIHQTYAEYFAALWISNNIRENDLPILKKVLNHFVRKHSIMGLEILLGKYNSLVDYVKSGDQNGRLMHELLSKDKLKMLKFLVKKGVEVNGFYNGLGLLHVAVILKKENMIPFLIENNIKVNQQCSFSSEKCRNVTVKILGTGWENYIEEGKTALDLAIDYGLVDVVEILLNHGAECNKHQTENALEQTKQNQTRKYGSFGLKFQAFGLFLQFFLEITVYYHYIDIVPRTRYVKKIERNQQRLPIRYRRQTNNRYQQMQKSTPKKTGKK